MTPLGKYELHEQLGRGGFGTVYRAVDTTLQREVALKVLHPQLTTDPDFLERFRKEARLTASLDNPHIIPIYELAESDGRVFIAMKYLPGGSLKQRLEQQGVFPFAETMKIIRDVCAGLEAAHKKGMVHRDVKPANILFDGEGRAVIGDFGLARAVQLSGSSASSSSGIGAGTPAYRAPELWNGKPPAGPSTDVYSLGCVLFEMVTGKALFDGGTPEEFLVQHLLKGANLPEKLPEGIPGGVRRVLEKALAKEQENRYQDVAAFAAALEGCAGKPGSEEGGAPGKTKEKESVETILPEPTGAGVEKAQEKWPWKKISIFAGAAAVMGLVLWIAVQSGERGGSPTPPDSAAAVMPQESEAIPTSKATLAPSTGLTLAPTREATIEQITGIGSTRLSEIDGMQLVYVPAGEFLMGSPEGVGADDEHPQHTVFLDAFWIDKTEVTNAMYAKCVEAGACSRPVKNSSYTRDSYYDNSEYADYPVIHVDWNQARDYCAWAGRGLPTEAQWEKAARGTDGRSYPWGNAEPDSSMANYDVNKGDTTAVGSYPAGASPYGALDMVGNVWEWVSDWYDVYPGGDPQASDYFGTTLRVLRGGSWNNYSNYIRSANRDGGNPSDPDLYSGFRCALSRH